MKAHSKTSSEKLDLAPSVVLLLILTAWGNAVAMAIGSSIAQVTGLIPLRKNLSNSTVALLGVVCQLSFLLALLLQEVC